MVGYKGKYKNDPVYETDRIGELTSIWSDHLIGRPENHMTGVGFTRGGYHRIGKRVTNGAGGYTVYRPDHWIFEGTGIDYGDVFGASATTVGYECDGCEYTIVDGLPVPTGNRRHTGVVRDPRDGPCGPLHPNHRRSSSQAPRAIRDRVSGHRVFDARGEAASDGSLQAKRCSARTPRRAAARSSHRVRPTGPTDWRVETNRSSRSRRTSSTALVEASGATPRLPSPGHGNSGGRAGSRVRAWRGRRRCGAPCRRPMMD